MNFLQTAGLVVPNERFDNNHLYSGASDPLGQTFRQFKLCRVEEEHLGGVVVMHAPQHPRRYCELSWTLVHAHLEFYFQERKC